MTNKNSNEANSEPVPRIVAYHLDDNDIGAHVAAEIAVRDAIASLERVVDATAALLAQIANEDEKVELAEHQQGLIEMIDHLGGTLRELSDS